MLLKLIYTVFIGVLFATFVGVGIAAFYKSPTYPEYPVESRVVRPDSLTKEEQAKYDARQIAYEKQLKAHEVISKNYNRNVSIIALSIAVVTLIISLTLLKKLLIIADGLLLGGVLTLCYSIVRGFSAEDDIFRFVVVSVGLLVSLLLGYIKFIKPAQQKA